MRKSLLCGFVAAMVMGVSSVALAEDAPKADAKSPGQTMQGHMKGGMMMGHGGMMGHHKRSCFDAAWQSEEWKRCESMMPKQPTK